MFDSDSEQEFIPAVLNRPKVANHIIHESFTVDTRDHEDHTFCGIMFDVQCKGAAEGGVPLEFLQIDVISVRGDLGPITVWTTQGSFRKKEHTQDAWECLYEQVHCPSREDYQRLHLSSPIRLSPGETCGLYVHSKLSGDDAIVYDNQRSEVTYEDQSFRVLPGLAHLSNRPFGKHGMWGFPWRERREFVGRISFGVAYMLWNPVKEIHTRFPPDFQNAVHTLLLCARKQESPVHSLQDEVIYYILNMCKHDWFMPTDPASSKSQSNSNAGSRLSGAARRIIAHCSGAFGSQMWGQSFELATRGLGPEVSDHDFEIRSTSSISDDDEDSDEPDAEEASMRSVGEYEQLPRRASEVSDTSSSSMSYEAMIVER